MENSNQHEVENESLRAQLIQLNERSRWYSSQLWQIPFAFLSLVALTVGTVIDKGTTAVVTALVILFFIGIFIISHMRWLADGEKRAVLNLQEVESGLFLKKTAVQHTHIWSPFRIAVCFATVLCLGAAIFLFLVR